MKFMGQFKTQIKLSLLRKPLFLFRIGIFFLRSKLGIPANQLRTMDIMLNSECNANCKHCFATSFTGNKSTPKTKLTLKEQQSALHEAVKNGVFHFSLQGGEPFLHPNLDDIIKACRPERSYITIVSNGTVPTEQRLREVYNLGVDKIAISIDSWFAEEHNAFRGLPGAHEKAFQTLAAARKVGLGVSIAVTVMNETLHSASIQKIFSYCIDNHINVDVNIPQPVGNWDGRTDLRLTDANFEYLAKFHKKHQNIRRDTYYHLGREGCPAGINAMYMNVYGDIFPCVFMHISIGNIKDHSLRDIRENLLKTVPEFSQYNKECLAGEHREFIEKYVSKGFGQPKPADGFTIFGLPALKKRDTALTDARSLPN